MSEEDYSIRAQMRRHKEPLDETWVDYFLGTTPTQEDILKVLQEFKSLTESALLAELKAKVERLPKYINTLTYVRSVGIPALLCDADDADGDLKEEYDERGMFKVSDVLALLDAEAKDARCKMQDAR